MFNPTLSTRLTINDQVYTFSPHPAVPALVWGQEGRHAIVYQIRNNGQTFALKVFRPVFRRPELVEAAAALWTYHELPGMRVCRQTVLTPEGYPDLIAQHEDLAYSMMMPWIDGETWFDIVYNRHPLLPDQSRALAEYAAWVLYALELNAMAHCDLSSGNVIISPDLAQVNLVDVEDLYSPWLHRPSMVPAGTPGYRHREVVESGQWGPYGDRFAGAVLLAEILGWAVPDVREEAWGESYFAPDELQQDTERYHRLREALSAYEANFEEAFEEAWKSDSLVGCPPIEEWYNLLDGLPRTPVAEWAPLMADYLPVEEVAESGPARVVSPRRRRRGCCGCRALVMIVLVALLFAFCLFLITIEWSLLNGLFS
jgi:hypothetical protein